MGGPYFEDVEVGETYGVDGRYEVTESEIVAFGERYEPWVHHVDPENAHESEYVERLTAGTLHVCAMGLRLFYDGVLADSATVDAVAVDDAWREYQVYPGDSLGIRVEVVDAEPLSERLGLVAYDVDVLESGDDLAVMTMTIHVAFERRTDD